MRAWLSPVMAIWMLPSPPPRPRLLPPRMRTRAPGRSFKAFCTRAASWAWLTERSAQSDKGATISARLGSKRPVMVNTLSTRPSAFSGNTAFRACSSCRSE